MRAATRPNLRQSKTGKKSIFGAVVDKVAKDADDLDILLRNESKFHVVLLNNDKENAYQVFNKDDPNVTWRTWRLKKNSKLWDVRQTENLIILEHRSTHEFEIFIKDQQNEVNGKPKVAVPKPINKDKFEDLKILEAIDYVIEFETANGRFLFDVSQGEQGKFIEYYEHICHEKFI